MANITTLPPSPMSSPNMQHIPETWIQRLAAIERDYALAPISISDIAWHIETAFERLRTIGSLLDNFDTFDPGEGRRDKKHTLRIRVRGFDALRNAMIKNNDQDFAEVMVGRVLDLGMQMRSKAVELNGEDFA
ncbi:uncharacterized protein H6S33_010966 [Morchella sextelata]|uniref:uncharacterized protein n=1 Tax=Morchella sextelata TaxID=1174677 RepID=UPI001D043818|nr:uncharacterized protein H6S33_010966 [Morchella sextelata]KAH0611701.1 hypothetical protein H6S33_010966 [Morchella sextelata]